MFSLQEIQAVLEKGIQMMQKTKNKTLAFEVKNLQDEIKALDETTGTMTEATQLSCEYYCNEITNTLSVL